MTTEAPTAPETAIHSEEYISSCNNLRLVRDPVRKKPLGEGADFYHTEGEAIVFLNGRWISSDPSEIEWLDNHPSLGTLFHKAGYGADGQTADNSARLISEVVKMAFEGQYQRIADVLVAERNSFSRPDVISACETILNEAGQSGS